MPREADLVTPPRYEQVERKLAGGSIGSMSAWFPIAQVGGHPARRLRDAWRATDDPAGQWDSSPRAPGTCRWAWVGRKERNAGCSLHAVVYQLYRPGGGAAHAGRGAARLRGEAAPGSGSSYRAHAHSCHDIWIPLSDVPGQCIILSRPVLLHRRRPSRETSSYRRRGASSPHRLLRLGVFKVATRWCSIIALALSLIIAVFAFHMPIDLALLAAPQGAAIHADQPYIIIAAVRRNNTT